MPDDYRKAHVEAPAIDPKQLTDVVKLLGGYGDADELRDLKQSVMACRTLGDILVVQATIRAIAKAVGK